MAPILALVIGKVLDYLADHSDELVEAIRKQFLSVETNPKIKNALLNLGAEPTEQNLTLFHDVLKEENEDVDKLAAILVNKAVA